MWTAEYQIFSDIDTIVHLAGKVHYIDQIEHAAS